MKINLIVKGTKNTSIYYDGEKEPSIVPTKYLNWEELQKEKVKIMSSYTELVINKE